MRKKITKIEKDLKALNKWLVGDKKKAKKKTNKKTAKKIKRKKWFIKKMRKGQRYDDRVNSQKNKSGIFRLTHVITF